MDIAYESDCVCMMLDWLNYRHPFVSPLPSLSCMQRSTLVVFVCSDRHGLAAWLGRRAWPTTCIGNVLKFGLFFAIEATLRDLHIFTLWNGLIRLQYVADAVQGGQKRKPIQNYVWYILYRIKTCQFRSSN